MALAAGTRLGPYEVLTLIGAGGMGEVYRARDTRLDRTVAIKLLPAELSADADRRARFEREAHTIAQLAHPHICTLYDVGSHDGATYLVMEHLAGETLATRIATGPLSVAQVLEIGAQVADALAAAHKQGIVHRDLKPANVMLVRPPSGQLGSTAAPVRSNGPSGPPFVKLLDFGLAKLQAHGEAPAVTLASAATQAAQATLTAHGTIVGTLPYMAPEQVQGQEADARTDLWALGAILYEMLTGARAFEASSAVSLVGAILEREPAPINARQPLTPPSLDRVVRRCLAKHPDDRWDTAHDVAEELRWIAQAHPPVESPAATTTRARYRWWAFGLSVLAAGILVGVAAGRLARGPDGGMVAASGLPVMRGVIELPADMPLALRVDNYIGYHPTLIAVSPDGARVAFVGPARGGSTRLYLRDLNGLEVRPIPDTEGALHPFFSPDGRWLGFLTTDKVKKVPLAGGSSQTLCNARSPMRASWTRDGLIYVGEDEGGRLSRVSEAGGPLSRVIDLPGRLRFAQILPDGRAALVVAWTRTGDSASDWNFAGDYAHIEVLSLDTLKVEPLPMSGYDARVTARGHLLFIRAGNLMVAPFDLGRRKMLGEPVLAIAGISTDSFFGWAQFAVSDNGLLVYAPGVDRALGELVAVDRAGEVQKLKSPERLYGALDLDRDGRRLAVVVGDVNDYVWIFDLRRQEGRKLAGERVTSAPIWSPDGKSVTVRMGEPATQGIYNVPVTDSGAAERVFDQGAPESWSPDGRWLAFRAGRDESQQGVVHVQGDRKVIPLPPGLQFSFSPDGRFLAYTSYDTGASEIWIRALADASFVRQVSVDGGFEPRWVGDHIFYRKGRQWFSSRVTSLQPQVEWEPPQPVFETDFLDTPGVSYAVSPDGQRLFVVRSTHEPTVSRLVFVQNWFEELKVKVPIPSGQ